MSKPEYQIHPAAEYYGFPMLEGEDREKLKEDIRLRGQIDPIDLCDEKILDGRNRYRACCELDIEPIVEPYTGKLDPYDYVWSKNFARRHLTGSQKGAAAALRATRTRGGDYTSELSAVTSVSSKTVAELAAEIGVSSRTVNAAKRVLSENPEAFKAIQKGKISADTAEKILRLPKERQASAFESAIKKGFNKQSSKNRNVAKCASAPL